MMHTVGEAEDCYRGWVV